MNKKLKDILAKMKKYSPFSQAVWLACLEIPKGETVSYKQRGYAS